MTARIRLRADTIACRVVLAGLLCGPVVGAEPGDTLRVVYLANEGFLLVHGETRVLIDALFGDGIDGYAAVPDRQRAALESGRPPYGGVDLVLASHYHADHFDARAVTRFLGSNPQALFVSTEQAVAEIRQLAGPDAPILDRALGYRLAEGETAQRAVGPIGLRLLHLHHGRDRPDIQNLGLLVEICGATVLHVGDTEADADDLRRAGLADLAPDVALLPSWFLRSGPWGNAVDEVLRPRRIVAMHLPTARAPKHYFWGEARTRDRLVRLLESRQPGVLVPALTGEAIEVSCRQIASDS